MSASGIPNKIGECVTMINCAPSFAQRYAVTKIVLFGSRARGTNTERSDVDIAVYGGDFNSFYWDVKENIHSLLMFDVVQADASISDELKKEIAKDGVVIYEKA